MRPFDDIVRLERAEVLDRPAAAVRTAVQWLLRSRKLKDVLHGVWLGHPLHPALAQLALGSFTSASLIDAIGGRRAESSRLIALGLVSTVPAVAAGWADWAESHEDQQRVGLVHAAINSAAITAFITVLLQRHRNSGSGRLLSLIGGTLSAVGAVLGGHLAYRQATGANHGEEIPHIGPGDWQSLGPMCDIPTDQPVHKIAGDVPVLVLRDSKAPSGCTVLSNRCPHLSAPLHQGKLSKINGELLITCPWHASVD